MINNTDNHISQIENSGIITIVIDMMIYILIFENGQFLHYSLFWNFISVIILTFGVFLVGGGIFITQSFLIKYGLERLDTCFLAEEDNKNKNKTLIIILTIVIAIYTLIATYGF